MRDFVGKLFVAFALVSLMVVPAHAADGDAALKEAVNANLESTAKKIIALAEATPDHMYSWRPNVEVRTVSEVYMHVVGVNMLLPAALGADAPKGVEMGGNPFALMGEWEANITSKEEVVAKLKESFEYVQKALASIDDLDAEVQLFGPPQPKRAYYMIILGHAHEHLGQAIAYTRSMGLVPPWSQSNDG